MASNAKKKTTFAKLKREQDVRERRERKQARREIRKREAAAPPPAPETLGEAEPDSDAEPGVEQPEPGTDG